MSVDLTASQRVLPSALAPLSEGSGAPAGMALRVRLAQTNISVWVLKLEACERSLSLARSILSPFELARCERVVDPRRRGRKLLARAALRLILAEQLGIAAQEVRILRSPSGRPVLDAQDAPSFSLSHSRDWVAIALGSRARVGIDIEAAGRRISPTLAARLLTGAETGSLASSSPGGMAGVFLAHWTAKEAAAKVLDGGLAANLRRLQLEDCASQRPRLRDLTLGHIELRRLELGSELHGALAAHTI